MEIKFDVKAEASGIAAKVGKISTNKQVGMFAANEAERLMQPYVPERDSILVGSTAIAPFKVTYNTPYARYQYEGRNIKNRTKATSMSHWDKGLAGAGIAKLAQAITSFIKGL